jgi:hypothetical protein
LIEAGFIGKEPVWLGREGVPPLQIYSLSLKDILKGNVHCELPLPSSWGPFWPPVPRPRLLPLRPLDRGWGRVPIAGWSNGGVGPDRGLRGGRKKVVV